MSVKDAGWAVWRCITWPFRVIAWPFKKLFQCFGFCLPEQEALPEVKAGRERKSPPPMNPALIQAFPPGRRPRRQSGMPQTPESAPAWTLFSPQKTEPSSAPPVDNDIEHYMRKLEEIEKKLEQMRREEHKKNRIAYRTEIMKRIKAEERAKPRPLTPLPDDDSDDESKDKRRSTLT